MGKLKNIGDKKYFRLRRLIGVGVLFLSFISCQSGKKEEKKEYIHYVNTFIGTAPAITEGADDHIEAVNEILGQTIPAVQTPNGMNSWTPQTRLTEKKCIAPYYYNDSVFYGFRASHWINGGCTQDYGSVTIMAMTGKKDFSSSGRSTLYNHDRESASPAYYSLYLPEYKLQNELTTSVRSAILRFTPEQNDSLFIVVTPNSDKQKGYVEIDVEKWQIRGYNPVHRIYQQSGKEAGFSGWFIVQFDRPFQVYGTYSHSTLYPESTRLKEEPDMGAYIGLSVKKGESVSVKCGLSFTSPEAASTNLFAEIPGWDFEEVKSNTEQAWEKQLSKIDIQTSHREEKEQFYSAFYRASLLPRIYNDVEGTYPAFGGNDRVVQTEGYTYYEDFCTWDIYRALLPLLTITSPGQVTDMVTSLVKKAEQGGWLPIFPCWNSYTSAMIGDHLIAIIGDVYLKGIPIPDIHEIYKIMRQNAFETPSCWDDYLEGKGRRALSSYLQHGFIPLEDPVKEAFHPAEQVSRTLEYAFDDFVLSRVALKAGYKDDYKSLSQRALNYKNVIDPETGYARGRYANGCFIEDFDPFVNQPFITEGYPCHYTWYVPHDPLGLVNSMGGKEPFIAKLDSLFSNRLYWHGNEPSHQIAYLYNWVGEPWKTQKNIAEIIRREYKNHPGGLSGNDDSGQMSAWYIFSALGFYPVCPGTNQYIIGTPRHPRATLYLENGKTFVVSANGVSEENIYIQSVRLNGYVYDKTYIEHADIERGGHLELTMGSQPSLWGIETENIPFSLTTNN